MLTGLRAATLLLGLAGSVGSGHATPNGRRCDGRYLERLSRATYDSIVAMVEPATGLPHDRFDRSLFDIFPQLAVVRAIPSVDRAPGARLDATRCSDPGCRHRGNHGLRFSYNLPASTHGSYNVASSGINASGAAFLELWVKGAEGGERFEIVLWSNCLGPFPGRPASAELSAGPAWERRRIPLADYSPHANIASLCRLSIGFNDAMDAGGTVFVDDVAFVATDGTRIHAALDEETSVTNIGLYMAARIAALELGWQGLGQTAAKLGVTLTSLEALPKSHGFPQTHNHAVSLTPSTSDTCYSTVDLGYLAAGLILVRQRIPALARRAGDLLSDMDWAWLYDADAGLPYGCRYPDGSASTFHYDWFAADSRLAHFIGIGAGGMPAASWDNLNRSLESPRCAERAGQAAHFDPGWDGGGLFMQYLPGLFLNETRAGLEASACRFARDQVCYARQIGAPAWGWSATGMPPYGADYCGYGCVRDDVLVPHASVLAVECVGPDALSKNLRALESLKLRPPAFDGTRFRDFGFVASGNWQTLEAASFHLVLDQSMALLALANRRDRLHSLFAQDPIAKNAIALLADYRDTWIPKRVVRTCVEPSS